MAKWKYKDRIIEEGKAWTDDNNILHPSGWAIWSADEKKAMGLTALTADPEPDSRLYTWTRNEDDTVSKPAKDLSKVKASLKTEVQAQQKALLDKSDWAIVRKSEKGTAVPANITTWRDAIRTKATSMESSIDGASDIEAVEKLFSDAVLYDWPELDS